MKKSINQRFGNFKVEKFLVLTFSCYFLQISILQNKHQKVASLDKWLQITSKKLGFLNSKAMSSHRDSFWNEMVLFEAAKIAIKDRELEPPKSNH